MTVPTGLTISGSPITTSGTLALSLTSGYTIPTTTNITNLGTAYTHSQIAGGDSVHVSTTENTNWDTAYTHITTDVIETATDVQGAETDPQVGTYTNTYVCYGTGTQVTCADAGMTYATGTDSLTLAGDIAVNGDDITSDGNLTITPAGGNFLVGGNVGIGTTAPSYKLDVSGDARVSSSIFSPIYYLSSIGDLNHAFKKASDNFNGLTNGQQIRFWDYQNFYSPQSGLSVMHLQYNGNVGIGTTGPTAVLHINKTVGLTGSDDWQVKLKGTSDATVLLMAAQPGYSAIQAMQDYVSWTNRPLVLQQYGGNVGIGTAAPLYKLAVNGTASISSTLNVDGATTLAGDIAVNGDDITSDGNLTITPVGGSLIIKLG